MQSDEIRAWLHLTETPGIGNQTARKLLAAFGPPEMVLAQSLPALQQVVPRTLAQALKGEPEGLEALVAQTLAWLQAPTAGTEATDAAEASESDGAQAPASMRAIVALGDPRYPQALLALPDPPLLLYLQGPQALLRDDPETHAALAKALQHGIAIVGSRNPTPQGLGNAREFAKALVGAGWHVVSGMALGVDGAAHEGALDAAPPAPYRLATVAVVGTGLDRVYPRRHLALARRIAHHGLLLSEYPIGTPPLSQNFPKRNRLIAALGRGTLVVEAALKSGSLITAREAADQGKEVLAIPGSIHSPQSRGCHALIKQGAKLVESAEDVLEELGWQPSAPPSPAAAPDTTSADGDIANDPLLDALGYDPVSLDVLQARTGIDTARLQAQLMALELEGQVGRLPGGLFQRIAAA